jgi:hypothetical protein
MAAQGVKIARSRTFNTILRGVFGVLNGTRRR